jgi:ADP-heptose:LPS heptosyltransferase
VSDEYSPGDPPGTGRVVCGDTRNAHVAPALGTPSVVLFGPVPPAEWGPPPDRPARHPLLAGILR